MNTKYQHIVILSVSAILSIFILLHFTKEKKQHRFDSRVFKAVSGWGYDILVDGKLFIHQESIPVISGNMGFPCQEEAEKTASLIINKMKRGKPPVVTTFELQKLFNMNDTANGEQGKY